MRNRTRPAKGTLLPAPENTTRRFIALALATILTVLLVPVGVQAAQTVSTIITDPGGTNQAIVDADGNLSVAGNVTVDSTPPLRIVEADAFDWTGLNAVQGVSHSFDGGPMFVSTIVAHLGPGMRGLDFRFGEGAGSVRLVLSGPTDAASGQQHYNLSLAQPVLADRWFAGCGTTNADQCEVFVSVVGTRAP
jgi:hypothetical protein